VLFGAGARLLVLQIIFLANTNSTTSASCSIEPDSRKSESCGRLFVAAFHLARELRQRQNRNVKFFRQRLEAGGDFGHLLHAAFLRRLPEPESSWM